MPTYPDATPIIATDIQLDTANLQECVAAGGCTVRALYDPTTQTMTVQVLSALVPNLRCIAERVIFTQVPRAIEIEQATILSQTKAKLNYWAYEIESSFPMNEITEAIIRDMRRIASDL